MATLIEGDTRIRALTCLPLPPGPKGHFAVGAMPMLGGDPLGTIEGWARTYGDVYYCRALHLRFAMVSAPELIEDVLVTQSHNFVHGLALVGNRRFLGDGLLTSEGDLWRRQRRLMQPAFHRRNIGRYASTMVRQTEDMVAAWKAGEVRDFYQDMTRLTLEIAARVLFDLDITDGMDRVVAASAAGQLRNARGVAPMYAMKYLPTPRNLRYLWTIHRLNQLVYGIIRQRRSSGQPGSDLLSALLSARDVDGTPMSDQQVRDEVVTLIFTGSETIALTLSYLWYLLARNPSAESRLYAEFDDILGSRAPGLEDLPELAYLERVIKEGMRLIPAVWAFVREALCPVDVGGYRLPAGTNLVLSQWVVHRDPRFYDRPLEFRPERWTEEFERQLPKFAYFPFGGGRRTCIGASLAKMQVSLMLATMMQHFRPALAPGFQLRLRPSITLQPKNGIAVVIEKRPGRRSRPNKICRQAACPYAALQGPRS